MGTAGSRRRSGHGVKRGHLLPALLCALLGFASSSRSAPPRRPASRVCGRADLVRILDDVSQRADRLRTEARDLEDTRARVTAGSTGSRAALQAAEDRAKVLGSSPARSRLPAPASSSPSATRTARSGPTCCSTPSRSCATPAPRPWRSARDGPACGWSPARRSSDTRTGRRRQSSWWTDRAHLAVPRSASSATRARSRPRCDIPGGVLDVLRQTTRRVSSDSATRSTITSLRAPPSPRYARPAPRPVRQCPPGRTSEQSVTRT